MAIVGSTFKARQDEGKVTIKIPPIEDVLDVIAMMVLVSNLLGFWNHPLDVGPINGSNACLKWMKDCHLSDLLWAMSSWTWLNNDTILYLNKCWEYTIVIPWYCFAWVFESLSGQTVWSRVYNNKEEDHELFNCCYVDGVLEISLKMMHQAKKKPLSIWQTSQHQTGLWLSTSCAYMWPQSADVWHVIFSLSASSIWYCSTPNKKSIISSSLQNCQIICWIQTLFFHNDAQGCED